tara:strand:- start:909 stop:1277 length:369 start_codon:yes stop_codon:yes gene_type:complete
MKTYFQGMITGAVFAVSILILMGQTTLDKQIKSQLKELESLQNEIDLLGKSMSESFDEDQQSNSKLNNSFLFSDDKRLNRLNLKLDKIYELYDNKINKILASTTDNNGILQDIYTDGIPCNN